MLARAPLHVASTFAFALASLIGGPQAWAQGDDDEAVDGADGADASAEDAPPEEASSAVNRAAAAEAYDRGSAFYLNEDFGRAARWFETAYRLAPAAPALVQAIRSQLRANHIIRATNLALRLLGNHGDDDAARELAESVLAEHSDSYVRLDLDCDDCTLEIDGRVWEFTAAMLEPLTQHEIVVTRGDTHEAHAVRGDRGERVRLGAPSGGGASSGGPARAEPAPASGGGGMPLSPWVFGVGVALTLVSAGVLVWSGVDTLDGVDAFNEMPTIEAFNEGEDKEVRTNVLIGVTAGLGALTLLFAILTDWGGDDEAPTASVFFDGQQGGFTLQGDF